MRIILIKALIFSLIIFLVAPALAKTSDLSIRWNYGRSIVLDDDSKWLVHPNWQHHSRFWNSHDRVSVRPAMKPIGSYHYILVKGNETWGIPIKYSKYPMIYSISPKRSHSALPYLYREKERKDNQMWNLLGMFWLSKQMQAQREQGEQYQEKQYKPKKKTISVDETSVVYIFVGGKFFHKTADCVLLKKICKAYKVNSFGASVRRARELGCTLCSNCFSEKKEP